MCIRDSSSLYPRAQSVGFQYLSGIPGCIPLERQICLSHISAGVVGQIQVRINLPLVKSSSNSTPYRVETDILNYPCLISGPTFSRKLGPLSRRLNLGRGPPFLCGSQHFHLAPSPPYSNKSTLLGLFPQRPGGGIELIISLCRLINLGHMFIFYI